MQDSMKTRGAQCTSPWWRSREDELLAVIEDFEQGAFMQRTLWISAKRKIWAGEDGELHGLVTWQCQLITDMAPVAILVDGQTPETTREDIQRKHPYCHIYFTAPRTGKIEIESEGQRSEIDILLGEKTLEIRENGLEIAVMVNGLPYKPDPLFVEM